MKSEKLQMAAITGFGFASTVPLELLTIRTALDWWQVNMLVWAIAIILAISILYQIYKLSPQRQAKWNREKHLEGIFEEVPDAIIVVENRGCCIEANRAACQLLALPRSQLLSQKIANFVRADFDFDSAWAEFQRQGEAAGVIPIATADGKIRVVDYRARANFIEGKHVFALRDITERQQSQEIKWALDAERKLSKMQMRFFTMTSHELRTPLSIILATAQLLRACISELPVDKIARNLQRIETTAKSMARLLDDLLTIARAESDKLEYAPHALDLEVFCRHVVNEVAASTESARSINFTHCGSHKEVYLDERLLRSVLTNLLSHALKYSSPGEIVDLDLTILV